MLGQFITYLNEQIGQPYLWGGQHTKLTPDNYVRVIEKKEAGRGGYPDGTSYAQAVVDFCKKKFDAGATELFAYDCSGLGVYWLQNLMHIWKTDANANTMMHRCTDLDTAGPPAKGWWVFRLDDSKQRATHIGYMVDNQYLIEAKGRKYGVVKTKFKASAWDVWGIPKVFEDEIRHPDPKPTGAAVEVVGGSVNVRNADSKKGRILFTAHKGDTFPYLGTAPSGWYNIDTKKGPGYITNLPRYTRLKE
jgi:cell wall-associated NlpC family hydrolase